MSSQHAHLSLRVLSHEIVVISEFQFMLFQLCPSLMLFDFPLFLFLSQYFVDIVRVLLVLPSSFIMLLLSLFQNIVEFQGLVIEQVVHRLFQSLLRLLLGNLLLAPISLL